MSFNQIEEKITHLEKQIRLLEAFIVRGQDNYTNPDDMIHHDSLIETIKDTVRSEVTVSVSAELRVEERT